MTCPVAQLHIPEELYCQIEVSVLHCANLLSIILCGEKHVLWMLAGQHSDVLLHTTGVYQDVLPLLYKLDSLLSAEPKISKEFFRVISRSGCQWLSPLSSY